MLRNIVFLLVTLQYSCVSNINLDNVQTGDTLILSGKYVCGFEQSKLKVQDKNIWLYSLNTNIEKSFFDFNQSRIEVKVIINRENKGHLDMYDFSGEVLEIRKE